MKAVFDTNILIDYLNGFDEAERELDQYDEKIISIITQIELLAGAKTSDDDDLINRFLLNFTVKPLDYFVANMTILLRRTHKRKLPDTIIYATAKSERCLLVTRNTKDFDSELADIRVPYML